MHSSPPFVARQFVSPNNTLIGGGKKSQSFLVDTLANSFDSLVLTPKWDSLCVPPEIKTLFWDDDDLFHLLNNQSTGCVYIPYGFPVLIKTQATSSHFWITYARIMTNAVKRTCKHIERPKVKSNYSFSRPFESCCPKIFTQWCFSVIMLRRRQNEATFDWNKG